MNALIVCNGFPPSKTLIQKETEQTDLVIGADGGGNILLKAGFTPDVVIGDLDSFQESGRDNFQLILDKDQETNDLEKALGFAKNKGAENVTVLGAFGLRMDHSLKNLSVMKQFHSQFNQLVFKDAYFDAFLINSPFETSLPLKTTVSLFPLSGKVTGITTQGLKYPLQNESLINGIRDGTSNINVETKIKITFDSGDLLIFIQSKQT